MWPSKAVRPALQRLLSRPTSLNILQASLKFDFCGLSRISDICQYAQTREHTSYSHNHIEDFEPDRLATVPYAFTAKERSKHTSKEDFNTTLQQAVTKRQTYPGDITRYEVLERESNVTAAKDHVTLLVDSREYRHNVELWLLLLQFRMRLNGVEGIAMIWHGLRLRDVDIPTKGPVADAFWKPFISLCPLHERSTEAIVDYANSLLLRTGRYYNNLYEEIVASWLKVNPKHAMKWHKVLYSRFPPPRDVFSRLCTLATTSKATLEAFRLIYTSTHECSIYDSLISNLCASSNYVTAQRWHNFLVKRGDIPSSDFKRRIHHNNLQQFIGGTCRTRANIFAVSKKGFTVTSEKQIAGPDEQACFTANNERSKSNSAILSRKLTSYGFGDYLSTKPGILDDKICARMISTRAFSLKLIIEFFAGLGLKELGPVALRELAIRVISPSAIARAIDNLNDVGIVVKDNVFSKAVRYFVAQKRSELLSNMLHSDLHPDAYDDAEVQQRLLVWYMKNKMWTEVNRTLEVITYEHSSAKTLAWNTLLQYFIRSSTKWRWIKYMDNMRICRIAVTSLSLKCFFNHRLASRQVSKRTSTHLNGPYDNISSYANVCLENLDGGAISSLHNFHEITKRLGMAGRMDELAFLAIRLVRTFVSRYLFRNNGLLFNRETSLATDGSKLSSLAKAGLSAEISRAFRDMFDESLIDAIVSWGFINGFRGHKEEQNGSLQKALQGPPSVKFHELGKWTSNENNRISSHFTSEEIDPSMPAWTKGIQLVSQLKNSGIAINPNVVLKSIRHRLWTIYGPAFSSRPRNRMLKQLHRLNLVETVILINKAWGSPLFYFDGIFQLGTGNTPLSSKRDDAVDDVNATDTKTFCDGAERTTSNNHNAKLSTCSWEHSVSVATRREEFLVYIFGEKRYVSKSEKRAINIREWACALEQNGDTVWIGL